MIGLAYWIPAAATAVLIAWLSHQSELPGPATLEIPDWVAHFLEYGFFTLTLIFAVTRGFDRERRETWRVLMTALLASAYGVTDEWHQSFVPGRDATVRDWAADTVGAMVMAVLVIMVFRRMAAPRPRV